MCLSILLVTGFSIILQTTGLTGLRLAKHPHASLKHYYDRILAVTAKMPKDSAYRVNTEAIVNARRSVVTQVCIMSYNIFVGNSREKIFYIWM